MNRLIPLLPILPFLVLALWVGTRSRVFFGALLISHALVHVMYFVPEPPADHTNLDRPFHLDRSWLLSGLGVSSQTIRVIGGVLALVVVIGFVITGVGLLANEG